MNSAHLYSTQGYFGFEAPLYSNVSDSIVTDHVTSTSIYYEPKIGSGIVGVMMASHLKSPARKSPHPLLFSCDTIDVAFYLGECSPSDTLEAINISNYRDPIVGEAVACSGVVKSGDEYVQRTSVGHTRGLLGSGSVLKNLPWMGESITLRSNMLTDGLQDLGMSGCTCFSNDSFVGSVNSRYNGHGIRQGSTAIIECLERLLKSQPAKTAIECNKLSMCGGIVHHNDLSTLIHRYIYNIFQHICLSV